MEGIGKFIVFEGIDGAGTTTQSKLLVNYLFEKDKAIVPLLTREPTMLTPEGREIRRRLSGRLLPGEKETDDFFYWANLFVNDRSWHLNKVVNYNLGLGITVVSDRFMFSTLAYQSAQGGQMEQLIKMHEHLRAPDLTIFLRVPVSAALKRIMANRSSPPEYFERKKEFMQSVAENYEKAIGLVGGLQNVVVIDGSLPVEEVHQLVQREVDKLYC